MKTTANFRLSHIRLLALLACGFPLMPALANPTGADVVSGQAAIQTQGSTLTVTTATNKSIINWQTFSIAPNEITRFVQPSAASSVLNRVLANEPSLLLGSLQSNGKIFLINPYGILVGAGAHIDVAGFVASTLNISNLDFLNDNLNFQAALNAGKVDNQGSIRTPQGGSVYLIAPEVENSGIISTPGGETILAAGQTVQLMDTATPGVKVEITGSDTSATNLGQIIADAGSIGMAGAMVRNSGTLDAGSVVREGGRIFLKATQNVTLDTGSVISGSGTAGGKVEIESGDTTLMSGTIESNGSTGKGGTVHVLGNLVGLFDNAAVSANGQTGGGTVLVGGDYQGKNPDIRNAYRTYVGAGVRIEANALENGNGGKAIVWADDITRYYGHIDARGGAQAGNGGFVEVSGKSYLDFNGTVNTLAPRGAAGMLLLDPTNISIVALLGDFSPTELTGQLFEETGTGDAASGITVAALHAALVNGNVTISTASNAGSAGNINFNADFDFNSIGGTRTLTLQANNNINLNGDISDSNSSTGDLLNLVLNPGGEVRFNDITINLGGGLFDASGKTVSLMQATVEIFSDFKAGILNLVPIDSGSLLTLHGTSSVGTLNIEDSTLTNTGNFTLTGAGSSLTAGGIITNGIGDSFSLAASSDAVLSLCASCRIDNFGTFNSVGNHEIGNGNGAIFHNAGLVTVSAGTLSILEDDTDAAGGAGDTGDYTVASGATLRFRDAFRDFLAGSSISGAGNVQFDSVSGGLFNVNGGYTPNGLTSITNDASVNFNSNVSLSSLLLNASNSTSVGGSGNIAVAGPMIWTEGAIGGSSLFTTAGATTISGTAAKSVSGRSWNNSGTANLAAGSAITVSSTLNNSGTFINNGTLTSVPDITLTGGIYRGGGTLIGNLINNGGIVSPGASPGIMNITGNYTQGPSGTLLIELGGLTPGTGYDVLNVSGTAILDGTLNVSLFGGFAPVAGNSFLNVITAGGGITGSFATTNFPAGYGFSLFYGLTFFDLHLDSSPSLLPDSIFSQSQVAIQSYGGPFYGVTVINDSSISGTTQNPIILASIQDLFIPADSPFTAGLFGTSGTDFADTGGFGFDTEAASSGRLPVASNIPFPLFYAQVSDEEDTQSDDKVLRRPFGMCSVGGD